MDNTNALTTSTASFEEAMISGLTDSRNVMYTSMKADTPEEKAALFAAMNNPEKRVADQINMTICVKDVFVEVVNVTNDETGEVSSAPRIVLIDTNGVGYQAVSLGLYSALKKLMVIYGQPTWENGINLRVRQITKGKKQLLTFDVVSNNKK